MSLDTKTFAISIRIGEVYDGTAPTFGTEVNWIGRARKTNVRYTVETIDKTGYSPIALDGFGTVRGRFTLDNFVPLQGLSFMARGVGGGPMVKRWIQIETLENKNISLNEIWTGVIEEWEWDTDSPDENQMERIVVNLNAAIYG